MLNLHTSLQEQQGTGRVRVATPPCIKDWVAKSRVQIHAWSRQSWLSLPSGPLAVRVLPRNVNRLTHYRTWTVN